MGFVSREKMKQDLNGASRSRRGRSNPLYDKIFAKILKIQDKPLLLEVTPNQRTGILGKLKKEGLITTRKDPKRPYTAKHKIIDRDASNKPSMIRMYIYKNDTSK
jgi:hypothetical protein